MRIDENLFKEIINKIKNKYQIKNFPHSYIEFTREILFRYISKKYEKTFRDNDTGHGNI